MMNHVVLLLKPESLSPGRAAQLVRASSGYVEVARSIPGPGTYKKQPVTHQ